MAIRNFKYQSDGGGIYRIRMDTAKATITGQTEPAGAISDNNVEVEVSEAGSRRKFGLHPRGVYGSRIGAGADLNKTFRVFVPCFTTASQTALLTAGSFTYKGNSYTDLKSLGET